MGMAAQSAYAGVASGHVTTNDERVELAYAYATVEPSSEDETREDVLVMLTTQPFTYGAIVDETLRMSLMEEKGIQYVKFFIAPDRQIVGGLETRFDPSLPHYSSSLYDSSATLELNVFNETHVEGRFSNSSSDADYDFDLTFQAEIQRDVKESPPTGEEQNAAANSPQAAVFLESIKAANAGDVDTLKTLVAAELAQILDGPDKDGIIGFLKLFVPGEVEFQKVIEEDGGGATLIANAQEEGEEGTLTLGFVKEGDAWRLRNAMWE
jgi:hypothetical protein